MGAPEYAHTRCEVHFHSDSNFDGTLGLQAHPLLGRIVGVSTNKSFGAASGSWTVIIKKPPGLGASSWAKLFAEPEGAWVRINYILDGQSYPIVWGMIDSISESVVRSDQGARVETYTVTGRDFGKALEDTKTIVNLFAVSNLDMFRGLLSAYNLKPPIGSPDLVVRSVIDLWLGNNGLASQQYRLPSSMVEVAGEVSLYEMMNFETIQKMDAGHGETLDMTVLNPDQQSGQALWDVLQQYCNGLINEMWVDLAPTRNARPSIGRRTSFGPEEWLPSFFLRERRFRTQGDTALWDNTRLHDLALGDVRSRQLAKGGAANRYNYWVLHGGVLGDQYRAQALTHSLGVEPFKPGAIPIINLESMQIHGIRPYVATTNFLPFFKGGEEKQGFVKLAANWLKRVHDWYGVAPWQLSGTITLSRMHPEIRIGTRVREHRADGPVTYYVEGVDHQWNYPGAGSTTLTVTHGQYDDVVKTPLDLLYEQYEGRKTTSAAASAAVGSPEAQPKQLGVTAPTQGEVLVNAPKTPATQQDPKMVGTLGSKDSKHAKDVATEKSPDPLPVPEKEQEASGVALSQEDLEKQIPIKKGRRS